MIERTRNCRNLKLIRYCNSSAQWTLLTDEESGSFKAKFWFVEYLLEGKLRSRVNSFFVPKDCQLHTATPMAECWNPFCEQKHFEGWNSMQASFPHCTTLIVIVTCRTYQHYYGGTLMRSHVCFWKLAPFTVVRPEHCPFQHFNPKILLYSALFLRENRQIVLTQVKIVLTLPNTVYKGK